MQTVDPALFGIITEAIADGLLVTAEDGTIVHVNGRMEALFAGFAASLTADTGKLAAQAVAIELRAAGVRC